MPHALDKTFEVHLQVAENKCPVAGGRTTVVSFHHHILRHDWLGEKHSHEMVNLLDIVAFLALLILHCTEGNIIIQIWQSTFVTEKFV